MSIKEQLKEMGQRLAGLREIKGSTQQQVADNLKMTLEKTLWKNIPRNKKIGV